MGHRARANGARGCTARARGHLGRLLSQFMLAQVAHVVLKVVVEVPRMLAHLQLQAQQVRPHLHKIEHAFSPMATGCLQKDAMQAPFEPVAFVADVRWSGGVCVREQSDSHLAALTLDHALAIIKGDATRAVHHASLPIALLGRGGGPARPRRCARSRRSLGTMLKNSTCLVAPLIIYTCCRAHGNDVPGAA